MSRSRKSARAAGTWFETAVAEYLAQHVDDRIERRTRNGSKDRGDIGGVRHMGNRVVIEAKNAVTLNLSGWVNEAEIERGNDDAMVGLVVHKRKGKGAKQMGDQYVTLTLADLVALLTGDRPS
ncbi:hypothetical protein [Georgenia thermotolerans]|uniref:hypothetical protein n=1 Tax=Georgenia thermotolerans TaxID=527326 RepID=UPI0012643296|nr:hypothetical protein [Georgenia thermotolerans]